MSSRSKMERRLLMLARENYNRLKEEFDKVLVENERLRQSGKKALEAERMYVAELTGRALRELDVEKQYRESLFQEFKEKTLNQVRMVYDEEIANLSRELSECRVRVVDIDKVRTEKDAEIKSLEESMEELKRDQIKQLRQIENKHMDEVVSVIKKAKEMSAAVGPDLSRKLSQLQSEVDRMQPLLESKSTDLQRCQQELKEASRVYEKKCDQLNTFIRDEADRRRERDDQAQQRYNDLHSEMTSKVVELQTQLQHCMSLLDNNQRELAELEQLKRQNQTLKAELAGLRRLQMTDKLKKEKRLAKFKQLQVDPALFVQK